MIEATQGKLEEAQFFYQHLVRERRPKTLMWDPKAFRFYFSAFIQAASSVVWVLHKEEKDKWEAWKPGWEQKLTTEELRLMKLTRELRNLEVKERGANPVVEWEEVPIYELLTGIDIDLERQHPAYGLHVFAPPGTPSPKTRRPAYYFEHEDGKEEVTALCARYLVFLEKMVNDFCAASHPASPT